MRIARIINNLLNPVLILAPDEAYRLWAPTYDDQRNNAILFLEERTLLPIFVNSVLPGMSIADFGCGTGRHIFHCLDQGAIQIVGIDSSAHMLSLARSNPDITKATFVQARIEEIPFNDSQFDLGLAALVLSHLNNICDVIRELARVLRPNGTLIISDLHWTFNERGWHRTFKSGLAPSIRLAVQNYSHNLDEYRNAFKDAHLDVVKMIEPKIDNSIRQFFVNAGMTRTYEKHEGQPLLVVFQVQKR